MLKSNYNTNEKCRISFNKSERYLEVVFKGEIYISDLLGFLEIINDHPINFIQEIKVLFDFRQSNTKIKPREIYTLSNPLMKIIKDFEYAKIADVVTSPKQVVNATLLKLEFKSIKNLEMELFNTKETALDWLGINLLKIKN